MSSAFTPTRSLLSNPPTYVDNLEGDVHIEPFKEGERLGFFVRSCAWCPHPEKVATGGEDSFLCTDYVIGVADGVGWWNQLDGEQTKTFETPDAIQPTVTQPISLTRSSTLSGGAAIFGDGAMSASQQYSESLMRHAFDFAEEEYLGQGQVPVSDMVSYAYDCCKDTKVGSSTCLLASVVGNVLQVYSLGDSNLLLVRNNKIIYATEDQMHGLNFPYQFGAHSTDVPADGQVANIEVRRGDLVIMGSDGIFDNIFEEHILDTFRRLDVTGEFNQFRLLALSKDDADYRRICESERKSASLRQRAGDLAQRLLQQASRELLKMAQDNANDPHCNTPFAAKCIESGAYHEGGKLDDMTLVVATITSSFIAEGIRFGANDNSAVDLPPFYKNWP
jgi:serine/threonine protein phosphatase PrpC